MSTVLHKSFKFTKTYRMNEQVNNDAINEVWRNAHIALQSISDIKDQVGHDGLKAEILKEYEGYEALIGELSKFMTEKGYERKDVGVMKKAMMWSTIKLNTAFDDSRNHIAELMIKGTNMGVTSLYAIINDKSSGIDEEIKAYAEKLKDLEEKYEETLKKFL